jgi:histone deacetylase 6
MMAAAAYDDLDDDADADEAAWDPQMPPPVYCTNCTARLYVVDRCSDCGHSNEHDSELLTCSAVSADTAAAAPAGECPLIIWDESMLLHEEGKHEPHPERPDRLRAVMAQLSSNGLTGGWGSFAGVAVSAYVCMHGHGDTVGPADRFQ